MKNKDNNLYDKKKKAVALNYDKDDTAPRVVAAGKGHLADRIIREADKEKVPVYQDEKLTESLMKLDLGEAIPSELYEAVAEILVFVSEADRLRAKL